MMFLKEALCLCKCNYVVTVCFLFPSANPGCNLPGRYQSAVKTQAYWTTSMFSLIIRSSTQFGAGHKSPQLRSTYCRVTRHHVWTLQDAVPEVYQLTATSIYISSKLDIQMNRWKLLQIRAHSPGSGTPQRNVEPVHIETGGRKCLFVQWINPVFLKLFQFFRKDSQGVHPCFVFIISCIPLCVVITKRSLKTALFCLYSGERLCTCSFDFQWHWVMVCESHSDTETLKDWKH